MPEVLKAPLGRNGLAQRTTIFTKGVFPTGLVEAFAQCLRSRIEEDELQFQALAKCFQIVPEVGNPAYSVLISMQIAKPLWLADDCCEKCSIRKLTSAMGRLSTQ